MSEATKKEEAGPEVTPAPNPLVKEPDQVQLQGNGGESPHSVVVEETPNPTETSHSLPVEEAASDDKTREISPRDVEPPVQGLTYSCPLESEQELAKSSGQSVEPDGHGEVKAVASQQPFQLKNADDKCAVPTSEAEHDEHVTEVKLMDCEIPKGRTHDEGDSAAPVNSEVAVTPNVAPISVKGENELMKPEVHQLETPIAKDNGNSSFDNSFVLDGGLDGSESGTEDEQLAFMKELENFFRERRMEFKPPKFYGEGLNCLKLWRAVTKLGGYDKVFPFGKNEHSHSFWYVTRQIWESDMKHKYFVDSNSLSLVTACKLWRVVGESFRPPKTCTTVSWTFRGFYEKALLDYERHKTNGGELQFPASTPTEHMNVDNQASGSGRMRRDAAARAMQGWHSQRILGNGEVSDPIIKDKSATTMQKRDKQLKSIGLLKRKKPSYLDSAVKAARSKTSHSQLDTVIVDLGAPADWVKINVQKTKDCFEVYALVPGLLREEVRVQSDPAGRLVISGEPENPDNPWGVTPFKKVVNLPSRIDPHQTSAVVTLHGQLFVRVPFEQTN